MGRGLVLREALLVGASEEPSQLDMVGVNIRPIHQIPDGGPKTITRL